jgi:TIR domain
MPKPLVFISHSAKEPVSRKILDNLVKTLAPDFEVLLDQYRLEANDDWRRELNIWMGLCQAAIVLLSKTALKSDWVLQEATILRWRWAQDNDFVLIPVLVPPVKHSTLEQDERFAPLALNEIQMISTDTPARVVARIVKRLEPLKTIGNTKTQLQELESVIAARLTELDTKRPRALQEAGTKLGKTFAWRSDLKYSDQLARALLGSEFPQIAEAVLVLAPYFDNSNTAIQIINKLFPLWVDPRAVTRLPEMVKLPQKQRAICVNGVDERTARAYVRRAHLGFARVGDDLWVLARVTLPSGYDEHPTMQAEIIEKEIVGQVLQALYLGETDDLFAGPPARHLEAREQKEPLFIIVPGGLDEKVLDILRDRFFRFTFFLLKGEKVIEPDWLKLRSIEVLKPELGPDTETSVHVLYTQTVGRVKKLENEDWGRN